MESLLVEQANLAEKGALSKCLEDVQRTIDILVKARVSVASCRRQRKYYALLTLEYTELLYST